MTASGLERGVRRLFGPREVCKSRGHGLWCQHMATWEIEYPANRVTASGALMLRSPRCDEHTREFCVRHGVALPKALRDPDSGPRA